MLWLTPFLFPSVALHALAAGDRLQAVLWLALYGTSTCLHSNPALFHPTHPLTLVDKGMCRAIMLLAAASAARMRLNRWTAVTWVALTYCPFVYETRLARIPRYFPTRWYPWHTSIHVAAVVGMHCLFAARRNLTSSRSRRKT